MVYCSPLSCIHTHKGIVEALVDSASDKSEVTRHAVFKALVDIGRKKHTTVLKISHSYLKKHGKVRWPGSWGNRDI